MMMGMTVQAVYMLVDTAFIGHWVGGDALAALGYVFPIFFIILGITFGLGTGVTSVIARYIGADRKRAADNAAEHSLLLACILGVLILTGGFYIGIEILKIQGASGTALNYALEYYTVMMIGAVFMVFAVFFRSILSGEGDNKMPMIILGVGTILNIILDPIFIHFYSIKGAAIATLISQLVVCIIFIYLLLFKEHSFITFSLRDFSFKPKIFMEIIRVGIPASLAMVIMSLGDIVFNRILNSADAVAAFQTAGRLQHLFFLPIMCIAHGLVTLVGMFYGANRMDLVKTVVKYGLTMGIGIAATFGIIFYIGAEFMLNGFTNSAAIISIASKYFEILVFSFPFVTLGMISSRIMQGLGHGTPMLIITALRVILISAPLAWYVTRILGKPIEFVWYSMLLSSFFAGSFAFTWMRRIISKPVTV